MRRDQYRKEDGTIGGFDPSAQPTWDDVRAAREEGARRVIDDLRLLRTRVLATRGYEPSAELIYAFLVRRYPGLRSHAATT